MGVPYNFCYLVVVFFTSVNFDPWFVFSQCCCLHCVLCYGKGNGKWKNWHVDDSSECTDWQRYILYCKTKTKQLWLSDLFNKILNASLLLRLKRIALQCNWTPYIFLFLHSVYLWNKTISCTVTVIKLQYTLKCCTSHEAMQSAVKTTLVVGGGEGRSW